MSQPGCFQLHVTGKLMSNCLNLRTFIIHVTSHLEESGSRISTTLQQCNQSELAIFSPSRWLFLPSQDGTSHNAKEKFKSPSFTSAFYQKLQYFPEISLHMSHFLVQNWVTWTPLNVRKVQKVNIWQKITELYLCPLKNPQSVRK